MKKYWQLLVIAGIIAATISVHYIQVASATKQNYNFTFENISGDDKYIDSLVIEANVENRMMHHSVVIKKDETMTLGRYHYRYIPEQFQQMIDKHKNFMRGKGFNTNNYFEDDTKLIYVEEPSGTWELSEGDPYSYHIDLLDKANNKKVSFEVQSEMKNKLNWMSIINIAVVNNEMKLFERHVKNNGDEEFYVVIIDLKKQQLLSESLIDTVTSGENIGKSFELYNSYYNLAQEKYNVYALTSYDAKKEEFNIISRKVSVLNMETNEVSPIQLPEGVEYEMQSAVVDNNYFIPVYITDTDTMIYRYNIGQQRWLDPISVPHPVAITKPLSNNIGAQNGKLYVMNETEKDNILQIFDIESGTTLYEGILSTKNENENYHIWASRFYEIAE
ncbi:hypothetical protein ACTHOQ_06410 [Solibacillus silvestris]|uniref:hypothetical protein n=1 Tax=Solibacillus silvestris TaxID=76853 RepID=UPI003F7D33FC